jgi:hydrogenase-4 component E
MFHPTSLSYDATHFLGALILLLGFVLLYQRRISGVITTYALQAFVLAAAAAWQAHVQGAAHLYATAGLALVVKAVLIPYALRRIVVRLHIHGTIETALGIGLSLIAAVVLVCLSILLILSVGGAGFDVIRETLALALATVLLGLLMMITRRNAVTQVIGFLSLENGVILGAVGVRGMPLVVELGIAFEVMVAFIIFGIFFFQIRERFDTLDLQFLERFRGDRK